jgi:hypothetical protein
MPWFKSWYLPVDPLAVQHDPVPLHVFLYSFRHGSNFKVLHFPAKRSDLWRHFSPHGTFSSVLWDPFRTMPTIGHGIQLVVYAYMAGISSKRMAASSLRGVNVSENCLV